MNAPGHAGTLDTRPVTPADLVGYDMIRRLVAFPTVSRDSNLELIEWVRRYLDDLGAATTLTFDDERRKANLFATLAAHDGNTTQRGIVLSGHTDGAGRGPSPPAGPPPATHGTPPGAPPRSAAPGCTGAASPT